MNNYLSSGLVKKSAACSLVLMQHIRINLLCTELLKWWYLTTMCFVLGKNLLDSVTAVKFWLYLKTLLITSGFGRWISKINYTSFIRAIKGNTLRITCLNAIYSASIVLQLISVCNLLQHNTGHPAYVISYPVCVMIFSSLSASAWAHPLENSSNT